MIAQPRLSESVAQHIRESIISGALPAGSFIRTDPLARELGVSLAPVREALVSLSAEGFVEQLPRRGFRVSVITPKDVEDSFIVQALIAGELAARATMFITDQELKELGALHQKFCDASLNFRSEEVEKLGYEFHRMLNSLGDSPRLLEYMKGPLKIAPRRFYSEEPTWNHVGIDEHEAVMASVRDRDPERARKAMYDHLAHSGHRLARHLESVDAEAGRPGDGAAGEGRAEA